MTCPRPRPGTALSGAFLCLALALPRPVAAQVVTPAPASAATVPAAPGTAVQLSPFEVSTDRDTGFAAALPWMSL